MRALTLPCRAAAFGNATARRASARATCLSQGGIRHYSARCSVQVHATSNAQSSSPSAQPLNILVLGGTGFVGRTFIKAARRQGHRIISLSRRGKLPEEADDPGVTWVQGDASNKEVVQRLVAQHPEINACLHCIGLLLDEGSGLSLYNKVASGSGSQPGPGASYDAVTRMTALNSISALSPLSQQQMQKQGRRLPFVFVSAAEAGWTFTCPVPWMERYLVAKRAVEAELLQESCPVRGVMLRPSLIWTWERPQALVSVLPFYVGNAIGLPFIDKPVTVETVVGAALTAIQDDRELGIKRYMDMERLSQELARW